MAVVIAACYLVAFLVPVWLMLIARMDAGNADFNYLFEPADSGGTVAQ